MRKIVSYINKTINRLLLKTEWYREIYWKGTTKFWSMRSCDYDIINLGSNSGKYAFNYEHLPIKGMNWAIGPQSLLHDFNILKNYFSYLKEGAVVLIPICPFSCLFTTYGKESNFKYYPILHPATIMDFDDSERTRAYRIKLSPFKEMPFYCIKETLKEIMKNTYRMVVPKKQMNFEKNAELWINRWKQQFDIMDLDAPMSVKHREEQNQRGELLREIILFCIERNLKPYIVLPPIHPSLLSKLSSTFMKHYVYDFIDKAVDDKKIVLDYLKDISFNHNRYFINSYLMNKSGALVFTTKILSELHLI